MGGFGLRLLPNLPAEFPQSGAGVQSWDTLPPSASFSFSGYIGHYHLTNQKWDPGPFDFKDFCRKLRGQGYALVELHRLDEATGAYQGCLKLVPGEPKSLAELGYIQGLRAKAH